MCKNHKHRRKPHLHVERFISQLYVCKEKSKRSDWKGLYNKLIIILADDSHSLQQEFNNREIDRSGRFRVPPSQNRTISTLFYSTVIHIYNQIVARIVFE